MGKRVITGLVLALIVLMIIPPMGVVTSSSADSRTYSKAENPTHNPYEYATNRKHAQIAEAMALD